jgi:hypothetical protein
MGAIGPVWASALPRHLINGPMLALQNDRSVRAACGTPSGPGEVQNGGYFA